MSDLTRFDSYVNDGGPAALVIREHLMSVEGTDGVLFPPTYAKGETFKGGYNVDTDAHGKTVALIDSVGSQANRIEPMFKEAQYKHLAPQVEVTAGDQIISIFEAGHRAGDALLRCTSLQVVLDTAFKSLLRGDATALAKVAPTSLVFGVWDSRNTHAKVPRVVASTIRAFDIRELTRSAVYAAPVDYGKFDLYSDEEKEKAEKDKSKPLSKRGFVNALASGTPGGVVAGGGVRRDATLSLAAVRLLHAGEDTNATLTLRRYILALALVAFTANRLGYLRQGCLLVLNPDLPREFSEVGMNGERKPCVVTHDMALEFASAAAEAFGVGESKAVKFDAKEAKADIKKADKKAKTSGKKVAGSEAGEE